MKATYYYRVSDYQGGFTPYNMPVEIIGESLKSYRIKYLEHHANGTRPGYTTWVRKSNIKLPGTAHRQIDTQHIRLPYNN